MRQRDIKVGRMYVSRFGKYRLVWGVADGLVACQYTDELEVCCLSLATFAHLSAREVRA